MTPRLIALLRFNIILLAVVVVVVVGGGGGGDGVGRLVAARSTDAPAARYARTGAAYWFRPSR